MGDIANVNQMSSGFQSGDNMGANMLMEQSYTNQNFLQYNPDVTQPSVDFSDKQIQAKAMANFQMKPAFVLGGYNKLNYFYNPVGEQINNALGK